MCPAVRLRAVADMIEQRDRLRHDQLPGDTVVVIRGGRDTIDKLRRHAERTARAWSLGGVPLLGISVFAVVDRPLEALLRDRFASFRTVHVTTAGQLRGAGFELLPTGLRPHFTVRVHSADDDELKRLLAVFGPGRDNPQYGRPTMPRREEG